MVRNLKFVTIFLFCIVNLAPALKYFSFEQQDHKLNKNDIMPPKSR